MLIVILLLSALPATSPRACVLCDAVDMIEENHFYDEQGKPVFDQIIFWDWNAAQERYDVVAWRLFKHPAQRPYYDNSRRRWEAVWDDGRVLRRVTADSYRETWRQYDPEARHLTILPLNERRGLSQPIR